MELEKMYGDLGISKEVLEYGARIEAALEDRFTEIDGNAEYNQLKVIAAMQKNSVSDIHFPVQPDMVTTTSDVRRWNRYMRMYSTLRTRWCARRSCAERTRSTRH